MSIVLIVMNDPVLRAGDILRPSPALRSVTTTPAATNPSAGTTAGSPTAQDQLARNARALQSVQAMQAAARALARAGILGTRRAEELTVAEFARLADAFDPGDAGAGR